MERIERRQSDRRRRTETASSREEIATALRDLGIIVAGFLGIVVVLRLIVAAAAGGGI
jgi:hypothetical protein